MGTPLQAVLHARYMDDGTTVGSKTYGGPGSLGACLNFKKQEALPPSDVDVSRTRIRYFDANVFLGGVGITGVIETSNVNKQAVNRAVNFLNEVYTLIGNAVYKYVPASGAFIPSLILTGKDGTRTNSLGLYPVWVDNTPTLVTAWNTLGANWRFAKLNGNTDTWRVSDEIGGVLNPTDADGGVLTEHPHGKRVYFLTSSVTSIGWFDYQEETFGTIPWSTTVRHPMDMCTFGGDLYCLNKDASFNVRIHRIVGTTTEIVHTFSRTPNPPDADINSAISTTNVFEGRPLLFVDNVYDSGNPTMYAQYETIDFSASSGLAINYFGHNPDGSLTSKEVAGAPAGSYQANPLKLGHNQIGGKGEAIVLRCFVDQKNREADASDLTNISAMTRMSFACKTNNGGGGEHGNLWYHQFTGSGTAPLFFDILKGDGQPASFLPLGFPAKQVRHRAFPHEKLGGGGRYYELNSSDETLANIVFKGLQTSTKPGVVRINYGLQTSPDAPSGTNVSVRWFYDSNLHAPESFCSLVDTSDGTISGVYNVVSIPIADKNYWVEWNARGDGATRNVLTHLNGQVATALSATTALTDPTDLVGLTLWLEANDETTITSGVNGDVSEWFDKSNSLTISGVFQSGAAFRPAWVPNSNNGRAGIEFISASGHFLFGSGSPVDADPMTTIVIYEPTISAGRKVLVSFSNDDAFLPDGPVGIRLTDANHYTMFTSGDLDSIAVETQETIHASGSLSPRELALPSGGRINNVKVATWREIEFEALLDFAPSGNEVNNFTSNDFYSPSGLSNTTIGRFSGSANSGIYPSSGNYLDGIIYEVAVYNRQLFDLEVERFVLYAQSKYTLGL